MALVLDLNKYKAPTLEVDFGFKTVSARLDDVLSKHLTNILVDSQQRIAEAEKVFDADLAKMPREEAKQKLETAFNDVRFILENVFDEMFNEPGLGKELYKRVGNSTTQLANVLSEVNGEAEKLQKQRENQKLNRYQRRKKK
ncbi:hypothetical protein [Limosilactobacillus mucosae]|jgi:hypothetical protein|uniref:hypothetical protein n=1 Tax=Limosilactobacillus mucosae TaxID=97478 RepID=UPI0020483AC3|nr:hypothetical protein [Limosilactobacillus mucosae]DAJ72006.1 MAG TPA: hypothetical protein [Caudoviricetes sp.]